MLETLARWSYHHRRATVLLWLAIIVGVNVVGAVAAGDYSNDFSLPGTEYQLDMETSCQSDLGKSKDFIEGVTAFMEKRPAVFLGL
jgi:uncharacterized membrane protein YdfJ with MMPL/SSD domain